MLKASSRTLLIAAIIAAIAVPLVLYQPVMATEADDAPMEQTIVGKLRCRARPILRFLKRAEPTEVKGEAIALVGNILILDVDGEQARVLMPPKWTTMDGEVVEREALVESIKDQTITVKALQASFENPQGVTISLILGYEIAAGEDFYAVLPFNIEIVPIAS